MTREFKSIETQLIHAGEPEPRVLGAVVTPIFQSSTYEYTGEASYHAVRYIRLNNTPNHDALHRKLAVLEGGEAGLATTSGMAAISTTLLTILAGGGHLLAQDCLYGGTHNLLTEDFAGLGISHDFIDPQDPDSWEAKLRPETRAVYAEAMTNPTLQVADHRAIVEFARARGLISIIDNTFATPINFRPLDLGYDVVVHSATKYLNGHHDIVAGAVVGTRALIEKITHRLNHLGGSIDPHAAFLFNRGLKTLALRMRYQNESALKIAQFLERHPAVTKVNYPGLESHPHHARARALFAGFGGMFSFELAGGVEAAESFLRRVTIPAWAASLGGVESLVVRPAVSSHAGMSAEDRARLGITDGLVRVSVGIEGTDDLIEDFRRALEPTES